MLIASESDRVHGGMGQERQRSVHISLLTYLYVMACAWHDQ